MTTKKQMDVLFEKTLDTQLELKRQTTNISMGAPVSFDKLKALIDDVVGYTDIIRT